MKAAIGGSSLLNIALFFVSIVILFFVGIIAYSKAYKINNRIIEVIEKHQQYGEVVETELYDDLRTAGYITATSSQVKEKCGENNLNSSEYLYCVYLDEDSLKEGSLNDDGYLYEVVTYIHFDFPIIGDTLTFAVKGETKILGKNYDY